MRKHRQRKLFLFHKDPYCYYCGIKTKLHNYNDGNKLSDDTATLDHLRMKTDSGRHNSNKERIERTVLSCKKCNELMAIDKYETMKKYDLNNTDSIETWNPNSIYQNKLW